MLARGASCHWRVAPRLGLPPAGHLRPSPAGHGVAQGELSKLVGRRGRQWSGHQAAAAAQPRGPVLHAVRRAPRVGSGSACKGQRVPLHPSLHQRRRRRRREHRHSPMSEPWRPPIPAAAHRAAAGSRPHGGAVHGKRGAVDGVCVPAVRAALLSHPCLTSLPHSVPFRPCGVAARVSRPSGWSSRSIGLPGRLAARLRRPSERAADVPHSDVQPAPSFRPVLSPYRSNNARIAASPACHHHYPLPLLAAV